MHGLRSGALRNGTRLPSTRELSLDLAADPRVVADAYRVLAAEGLLEIRPRSGVYVVAPSAAAADRLDEGSASHVGSASWLAGVVADGIRRGVPAPRLHEAVDAATRHRTVSAAVIAATLDQSVGLARELRDDFGFEARGFIADELVRGERLPRAVERAQLLVGTEATGDRVQKLAARLRKPSIVVSVRPDLLSPEWRLLLSRVAYIVIADPRFRTLIYEFFSGAVGEHNVRILIAGRDDVGAIPPDAPTYITEAARQRLGRIRLPGRLVAPARTMSDASLRAVAEVLVAMNLGTA
jgi:DNA-binding transcriptional regulator YhcF (GntR family)